MGADGSVVIEVDANVSKAEKKMAGLKEEIEKSENDLNAKQTEQSGIQKQLDAATAAAEKTKAAIAELAAERDRLSKAKDDYNINSPDSIMQSIEANERLPQVEKDLAAQTANLEKQEAAVSRLENRYNRVAAETDKIASNLDKAQTEAGELQREIDYAASPAGRLAAATENAETRMERFNKRVQGLASRVFEFSVITRALRAVGEYVLDAARKNDEFSAALARTRGALTGAFQPILTAIIPILTFFLNILTAVIQAISWLISLFTGWGGATDALYEQADAIGAVGGAAGKASKELASFDEINRLGSPSGGGGGAGGGLGDLGDLTGAKGQLTDILGLVAAIGAGLAAWTITKIIDPEMTTLSRLFESVLIGISVGLVVDSISNILFGDGVTWENILEGVVGGAGLGVLLARRLGIDWKSGGLTGAFIALGLALFAGSIRSVIDNGITAQSILMGGGAGIIGGGLIANLAKKLGWKMQGTIPWMAVTTGLSLAVQAITSQITEGVNLNNTLLSMLGIAAAVAGIGFMLGGPLGALAGFAIGAVISLAISSIIANWEAITEWFAEFKEQLFGGIDQIWNDANLSFPEKFVQIGVFIIEGLLNGIVQAMANFGSWVYENLIAPIVDTVKEFFGIASPSTVFHEIGVFLIEGLFNGILEVLSTFSQWAWDNIVSPILEGIKELFGISGNDSAEFKTIGESLIAGMLNGLKNTWHTITDFFTQNFPGLTQMFSDFITGAQDLFNSLVSFITDVFQGEWENAWENVKEGFRGVWNGIIGFLEQAVNYIIRGINKIKFTIPSIIPGIGGREVGFSLSEVSLPRLATGAVIPPNREFLAVLGDQKSGTNIEAPLATIEQAVRNVMRDYGGGNQSEFVIMVGPDEFGRLVRKYGNAENRRIGIDFMADFAEV